MPLAILEASTPHDLARLLDGRTDDEIAAAVAAAGAERTLDQVFTGMVRRYLPGRGPRRRTVIEFSIRTESGLCVRQFVAGPERASFHEGVREGATAKVELGMTDLLHLVSGRLSPMAGFMQGKLKLRGNYLVARRIRDWFDRSG